MQKKNKAARGQRGQKEKVKMKKHIKNYGKMMAIIKKGAAAELAALAKMGPRTDIDGNPESAESLSDFKRGREAMINHAMKSALDLLAAADAAPKMREIIIRERWTRNGNQAAADLWVFWDGAPSSIYQPGRFTSGWGYDKESTAVAESFLFRGGKRVVDIYGSTKEAKARASIAKAVLARLIVENEAVWSRYPFDVRSLGVPSLAFSCLAGCGIGCFINLFRPLAGGSEKAPIMDYLIEARCGEFLHVIRRDWINK